MLLPLEGGAQGAGAAAGGSGMPSHRAVSWEPAGEQGQAVTSQHNPDLSPGSVTLGEDSAIRKSGHLQGAAKCV